MEKERKYGSYILLCLVTLILVVVAVIYTPKKEEETKISDFMNEIKYEEIKNHIVENINVVVYASSSENKDFEAKLKKAIIKYNLREKILYLNTKESIEDTIYQKTPIMVFYYNKNIVGVVDVSNFSYSDLVKVLKDREIIDD